MLKDDPVLAISAAIVAALAVAIMIAMRPSTRFIVAGALSVPLFFLPGLPLPVGQLWFLMMGLLALFDPRIKSRSGPAFVALVGFSLVTLASALWSDDPGAAESSFMRLCMFLSLCYHAIALAKTSPRTLDTALKWVVPWLLLQTGLVFTFRIAPEMEMKFLKSSIADIIVGPFAQALFNGSRNNVFDPVKSGGLFVNANVASMFAGVSLFVLMILYRRTSQNRYLLFSVIVWASVFFTGSKTGASLAIALPIIAFLASRLNAWRGLPLMLGAFIITLPITSSWLDDLLIYLVPSYAEETSSSYATREGLWSAAWDLFQQNPFLGLGFGGWEQRIGVYIGRNDYPPHNLFIDSWSKSGILAVALAALFFAIVLFRYIKTAFKIGVSVNNLRINAYGLAAWLWVIIHGMGDNTGIYGEWKSMFMLATLLGYQLIVSSADSEDTSGSTEKTPPVTTRNPAYASRR